MTPQTASGEALGEDIQHWARELGFEQVGIAGVDLSGQEPHVRRWLERGFNGEMGYLERNVEKRLHPPLLEAGTCTVISARMNYLPGDSDPIETLADPSRAYIARYALGRDYHKLMRRRLAKLALRIDAAVQSVDARFRAFTDSAPVLEKALGEQAGLGWIGKHTLLIHPDAGSWFFLGEIYTNIPLSPTEATEQDRCGNCRACMTVCPTGAIVDAKLLDARRCISYLTIEHKTSIPEELRPLVGNRIFGCDDCQLYCPFNRDPETTGEEAFRPRVVDILPAGAANARGRTATAATTGKTRGGPAVGQAESQMPAASAKQTGRLDRASLLELFAWDEETFLRNTEGSALRRIDYERWQRNLAVALGNGPPSLKVIAALQERLPGATPMVREHLEWALARLQDASGTDCA
ncbi:MAG: tRNA epoxyqueuosine(34) reductase QueG [Gammaproteobacteria bacterium]|nr:tRNA epoxyqueuosine(34) reductase QueG [Gammaproteobacteria bacterium]